MPELKERMKVQEQGGINWTWFKVQNGNLVAVFRLHYREAELEAFCELQKDMIKVENIDVPFATWREKCDLITSYTDGKTDGYNLPEVAEAFGWLNEMFRRTTGDAERKACPEGTMRHLEYHGVAICRVKKEQLSDSLKKKEAHTEKKWHAYASYGIGGIPPGAKALATADTLNDLLTELIKVGAAAVSQELIAEMKADDRISIDIFYSELPQ